MKHTAKQIIFQAVLHANQQYTSIATIGNKVFTRARDGEGTPIYVEQKYEPVYYVPEPLTKGSATHRSYDGKLLTTLPAKSIWDAKEFNQKSKLPVYGDIQCEYMVLSDVYGSHDVQWDMDRLYIWDIDIEVDSENGYAKPDNPFAEVTAITVIWRHLGKTGTVVYGCKPYVVKGDELYLQCDDEGDMLRRFLEDFRAGGDYPDIVTGWYVQFYDVPYLVKRMQQLFSEDVWIRISPLQRLADRNLTIKGRSQIVIDIKGIAILDYLELYQKFSLSQQENYRLDHIAHVELGERKLSFEEFGSLRKLYKENYQKFIEYNIQDVRLVEKLDAKKKLLELVAALAYGAKANFVDTFKQVRLWDIMIYHHLRAKGMQIPPRGKSDKGEQYAGAYVKEPKPAMYNWVCSFDVASMYPHIIRQWNLSPETKLDEYVDGTMLKDENDKHYPTDAMIAMTFDTSLVKQRDVCMAVNGVLTNRHQEGFLPEMLKTLYDERNRFKGLQKQAKKALEHETDPVKKAELKKQIDAYGNQQQTRKVNLNSAYGAMGSEYFRFFDVGLAEAVTVTGQMVIRRVANDINDYLNQLLKTKDDYIIASDTDSVYVHMEKVATIIAQAALANNVDLTTKAMVDALNQFCEKKIQPIINDTFVRIADYMNVAVPCMSMVRDVIADKAVWMAKKRYVMHVHDSEGVRYETPEVKAMGIEAVKSSTPGIVRVMFKDCLRLLMTGTQAEMWAYVDTCRETFRTSKFEDIASPRSINGLKKYAGKDKSIPIAVRGAATFNEALERTGLTHTYEPITDGEKIRFCYLKLPNPFHSHVMSATQGCPPEWEMDKWLDRNTQFDKTFVDPLNVILHCAGWTSHEEATLW